jgi:hypothetical protein
MSSDKSLVGGEVSYHDESIGEELEALHAEIDAIIVIYLQLQNVTKMEKKS